jgi:UPF0176 protein
MTPENKDLLCLSMLMQIQDPTQFRNDLFLAWNPLEVLGRIYVANEGTPNCPFLLIISTLSRTVLICFHERNRLNIAIEQDDHSFKIND